MQLKIVLKNLFFLINYNLITLLLSLIKFLILIKKKQNADKDI